MPGTIFRKTLFDSRRSIVGWGIAAALLCVYIVLLYPYLNELEGFRQLVESLPPIVQGMLGDVQDMFSPQGYLSAYLFNYAPLLLAAYGILAGASAVAGEEKRGTIDLLMSTPVPRWRVMVEKFAAFVVATLGVLALMFVGTVIALAVTPSLEISIGRLIEATLNIVPITLVFGALAFCLSAALPSRMSAGMWAALALVAFYMLSLLAPLSSALESVQGISPFHYYNVQTLAQGIEWGGVAVLLAVSAVLMGLAVLGFERRDLAV